MEKEFENLTLIIPTYNRFLYLERALKYYLSFFPAGNIIVLDSSFEGPPEGSLTQMLRKVVYKKFPKDIFLSSKIDLGLKEVRTPYSVLSPDDDFLLEQGLKQALDFLSAHDDYSCAYGDSLYHGLEMVEDKWVFRLWPLRWGYPSIEDTSCDKRLMRFFPEHYDGVVFYAIYHTKILQRIWVLTAQAKLFWGLFESVSVCQAYIYGKVKAIPVLYISREINLYEKTVPQSRFWKIGSNGKEILNKLIEKGILEKDFAAQVRLKENADFNQEMIREIAGDDFDEVWLIIQESLKMWVSGGKEEEEYGWYSQERIAAAVSVLMQALAEAGGSSLSRKTVETMFFRFKQLEDINRQPDTWIDKIIFKFANHFRFKKIRKVLATDPDVKRLQGAVVSSQIDPRTLNLFRMTYLKNNVYL